MKADCPTEETLLEFLEQGPSASRESSLAEHINACIECQRVLQRLADVTPWPHSAASSAIAPWRIGRYEIYEEIARGGMGVVLRGRAPQMDRELAFKVVLDHRRDDPATVQRFFEEARITGQLQHPGIPPIHDLGRTDDGRPYYSMKLVRGRTLADLLHERKSAAEGLISTDGAPAPAATEKSVRAPETGARTQSLSRSAGAKITIDARFRGRER